MKIENVALAVIDALVAADIPYMLVGSFSSNFFGIPRSTADVDFVIEVRDKSIGSIVSHLPSEFKLEPQMSFETVTGTMKSVLTLVDSDFKVELFRLSSDPHDQERFRRRKSGYFLDREIIMPTAEDVIIMKLRWFRRKDSEDVQSVLAVQKNALDFDYIHYWCEIHGTRKLLEQIQASISPLSDRF